MFYSSKYWQANVFRSVSVLPIEIGIVDSCLNFPSQLMEQHFASLSRKHCQASGTL